MGGKGVNYQLTRYLFDKCQGNSWNKIRRPRAVALRDTDGVCMEHSRGALPWSTNGGGLGLVMNL